MMENESIQPNKVKAIPTSPIYAQFDLVEVDGKQMIAGVIGFTDQFGMERMAKFAGEKFIHELPKHVIAVFNHQIDIIEPDEETKQKLRDQAIAAAKQDVIDGKVIPIDPSK